ncbi:MAG: hypothetical protein K2I17_02785 [Clostridia bacterium]|nr:hypothetical protein [Clostridia bacterium]
MAGTSRGNGAGVTGTATITNTVTVTPVAAPTVSGGLTTTAGNSATANYTPSGTPFTFTYNQDSVEVSSVSLENTSGNTVNKTSDCTIDTDGLCTLTEAGTYTFTFKIKDTCGAVWNSTTNDQSPKTVTVTINPVMLNVPSGTVTAEYTGNELTVNNANTVPAWYDNLIYTDTGIMTVSPATVTDANESGYNVTATIVSGGHVWSDNSTSAKSFTFIVNKKQLSIDWTTDDNGYKVAQFADVGEIHSRDNGDKYPQLVTKYYKDGDSPTNLKPAPTSLGTWNAVAVLDNAATCNYKVDATASFNAAKRSVAYPTVIGIATEEYNGTSQEFNFTGFDANLMTYTVPNGVDSFDGAILKVTNVGTYTPVFTLKDTTLYDWTGTAPGAVEITAKPVLIVSDDGNATEWQRRTPTTLTFDVPTTLCGSDSTLKFEAAYTLNGGDVQPVNSNSIAVNGKTCTVTIGAGFAKGNYALTVKIADGENYSGSVTHAFNITAQGLSLGNNDIKWNIAGKTFVTDDYDDGSAVFEMQYTGTPLSLQNVSVNFSSAFDAAQLVQDGDLTGTFINAVNVGDYTATFKIKAASSEYTCSDGPFTITIKIVPKVLDFSNAVWQWQYVDGGEEWKTLADGTMPSFDNKAVSVRISPDYMLSLGLAANDYSITYSHDGNLTEKGDKSSTATITITNGNYAAEGGEDYIEIPKDWKITAKSLTYSWEEKGQTVAGPDGRSFEFPAIVFADGNTYTEYYEYYFTVDGVDGEMTREELEAYLADNWSDTTTVRGRVNVRMKADASDEFVINPGYRSFTTGTPKTALSVAVSGSGAEYGKVSFALSVVRGTADESRRTEVEISGGALESARTFDGDDTELIKFMNKLGAGKYAITVSLKSGNEDSYVLTQSVFEFEVLKCNVQLPTVREIVFTGETIYLIDYLDGFDSSLMKLIGAAEGENGIVSGRDYRKSGYFTTIALIDGANYQFVKAAESSEAETVKATLKFAVAFADGEEVLGSEYEINWMINRFRITDDMWDKSGKQGVTLKLPAQFAAIVADKNLLDISYAYYDDQNGAALEEFSFKGGNSYWVNATLTGEEANNFEFENGLQISDKTVYTVPQSKTEAFFNNTMTFVKNNMILVIGCAAGLLLLILLIIIIACAARSRKKKREREEQRRLEEKAERERREEREEQRRREEREERMARMSQQQMMMPQMMPQGMPQAGGQTVTGGGSADSALLIRIETDIAAMKAAQEARDIAALKAAQDARELAEIKAEQSAMRSDINALRGSEQTLQGNITLDKLTELIELTVEKVLERKEKPAAATPENAAAPAVAQVPPDAVMTTVTTTKIDTTKKPAQNAQAAAPVRTVVRNVVAPMPVDDGRVFDVGGFYTPADPMTDMGFTNEENKD